MGKGKGGIILWFILIQLKIQCQEKYNKKSFMKKHAFYPKSIKSVSKAIMRIPKG